MLDLASYGGEFLIKLHQEDTKLKVTASDIELSNHEGPAKTIKLDLNTEFRSKLQKKFDYVTAIEVIEHLENPYMLFRNVNSVLKKGGSFILSTPNVASLWGKLLFFFTGEFWLLNFGRASASRHGKQHISVITPSALKYMARLNGFSIAKVIYVNHYIPLPYIRIPSPIKIDSFSENVITVLEKA